MHYHCIITALSLHRYSIIIALLLQLHYHCIIIALFLQKHCSIIIIALSMHYHLVIATSLRSAVIKRKGGLSGDTIRNF